MTKNNPQTNMFSFMLTPELVGQIYKEVKKAYLKKDGTPFKRYKCFWVKNLIDIVAERMNLNKEIVEIGINKLTDYLFLIKDHMNTIHYFSKYEEHIKKVNKREKDVGSGLMCYSTKSVYIESWIKDGIHIKYINGIEVFRSK